MTSAQVEQTRQLSLLADLELSGNLTTLGFQLPVETTYEQFEAIARMFGTAHESLKWAIGDLLVQGSQVFSDDVYQAAEALGISKASQMQYMRVAERIPIERRNGGLTWSHHRSVVSLEPDEQDTWLRRAVEGGWSKSQLEEMLRSQREVPTTTVREHERRLPGYVVEVVCDAAERVAREAEQLGTGDYSVPGASMLQLKVALGVNDAE